MPSWLYRLFHNDAVDKQLDAELKFHLEYQIADNIADGMRPEEARRRAQIEIGGVEQVKQECRDAHWENFLGNIVRDFRYALRSLNKDRRFALTAIFALALGIGACTVVFSVFYNLLFNAFDTRDASRLVVPLRDDLEPLNCTVSDIDAIREQNHVFEDVVGYNRGLSLINDGPKTHQLYTAGVTANAFTFYGVPALLGRSILPADGTPGAEPVFVISYDTWTNEFNSDPQIVGKSFTVSDEQRTLVGVMPPRFHAYGALVGIWFPFIDSHDEADTKQWWGQILARLKPGVTLAAASADLKVIVQRLANAHPDRFPKHFSGRVQTATDFLLGPYGIGSSGGPMDNPGFDLKHMLYSLLAGGLMLLLMACSNVANLLLTRATVREKEIAVRAALGATRGRLIQQLLLESSVLAMAACALGCVFAYFGSKVVTAMIPHKGVSVGGEVVIGLDRTVLLFTLGITALATLVCGLTPAFHAVRRNFQPQLSGSGKGITGDFRHGKLRGVLVISQVTISVVLLIGAGLLIRSFFLVTHVDLGFNPKNVLIAAFGRPGNRDLTPAQDALFHQKILQRLEASPGIASVASCGMLPGYNGGHSNQVTVPGTVHVEEAGVSRGGESLLQTLEFRLIRGRRFSKEEVDSAQYVAVINQTMARNFFGDADPVGQQLEVKSFAVKSQPPHDAYFQIVGVIADIKNYGPTQPALPQAFIPYTIQGSAILILKTKTDPASLMHSIQEQIWAMDRDIVFGEFTPVTEMLNRFTYSAPKLVIAAVTPLAAIGLLLVIIGVFSVMAYTVSLQTHDIGIRLALGAQQGDILRMVLRKGLMLIAAGVVIGGGVSLGLTRFLASQLWGVSPTDPWTFAAVLIGILVAGFAACFFPALRATQVDPAITLRYE